MSKQDINDKIKNSMSKIADDYAKQKINSKYKNKTPSFDEYMNEYTSALNGFFEQYNNSSMITTNTTERLNNFHKHKNQIRFTTGNGVKRNVIDVEREGILQRQHETLVDTIQNIVHPLIEQTTHKKNTPEDLTKTSIEADKLINSISLLGKAKHQYSKNAINADNIKAASDLLKKEGRLIYFDTETLGGADKSGQRIITDITDLSYMDIQIKDGKIVNHKNQKYFWGIAGKNAEAKIQEYEDLIDTYQNNKSSLTNKDLVTLKRLALSGHEKTVIENHEIKSFATKEDLTDGWKASDMKKGLERFKKEYEWQHKTKDDLMPWEQEFLDIVNSVVLDPNAVISGNNIYAFDIPAMKQFADNNLSNEAKHQLHKTLGGQNINDVLSGKTLDVLPMLREALGNEEHIIYTQEQLQEMSQKGLTTFQLEALKRLLPEDILKDGASHTSAFDTWVGTNLLLTPINELNTTDKFKNKYGKSGETLLDILVNKTTKNTDVNTLNKGQLFLSHKSFNANNFNYNNALMFSTNELENIIKAPGKAILNKTTNMNDTRNFDNYPISRGLTYSLQDYGYIDLDNLSKEEQKKIKDAYYFMQGEDRMYYAVLQSGMAPEMFGIDKDSPEAKMFEEYGVILGTENSVNKVMSDFELISEDGKTFTENAKKSLTIAGTDGSSGKIVDVSNKIGREVAPDDFSKLAWGKKLDDRATRSINKTDNYNQIKGMLNFFEEENKFIKEQAKNGVDKVNAKKNFQQDLFQDIHNLSRSVSQGRPIKFEEQQNILNKFESYFGRNISQEELRNLFINEEFYRQNKDLYQHVVDTVQKQYSSANDYNKQKHLFNFIMENIHDRTIDMVSEETPFLHGFEDNFYEVDLRKTGLKEFAGLDDDDAITRIHLDKNDYNFFDKIASVTKKNKLTTSTEKQIYRDNAIRGIAKAEGIDYKKIKDVVGTDAGAGMQLSLLRELLSDKKKQDPASAYKKPLTSISRNADIGQLLKEAGEDPYKLIDDLASSAPKIMELNDSDDVKAAASKAVDLTSHVPENIDEILINKGMDIKTAQGILLGERIRRKESLSIYESLIDSAKKHGIDLGYDGNTNTFVIAPKSNGDIVQLPQLPQRVFKDGLIATKTGNALYTSPLGIGINKKGDAVIESSLAKAQKSTGNIDEFVRTAINNRLEGETSQQAKERGYVNYIKKLAENMREPGAITYSSSKELQSIEQFDFSNVVDVIKKARSIDIDYDNLKNGDIKDKSGKTYAELFKDTIEKIKYDAILDKEKQHIHSLKSLPNHEANLMLLYAKDIVKGLPVSTSNETQKEMISHVGETLNADNYANQVQQGILSIGNHNSLLPLIEKTNRGIDYQSKHLVPITPSRQKDMLSNKHLKGRKFGRVLETKFQHETNRTIVALNDKKITDTVRTKALYMTNSQFHGILDEHGDSIKNKNIKQRLDNLSILEGAGAINPRLADTVYPERTSVQKINFNMVANKNTMDKAVETAELDAVTVNKEFIRRSKLAPKLQIDADNKTISFKYGDSQYVQYGDKLITVNLMDGTKTKTASNTGFFEFGLFDDTTKIAGKVDEEEISAYLTEHYNELQEFAKSHETSEINSETAVEFLMSQREGGAPLFSGKYYVDNIEAMNVSKYVEGEMEKTMSTAPRIGLGLVDSRISDFLSNAKIEDMHGTVLSTKRIEELANKDNVQDTFFGKIYKYNTGKALTDEALNKALTESGFRSKEELASAIMQERYSAWDSLVDIYKELGIDASDVDYIGNKFEEHAKHGNITPLIESSFLTMKESGKSDNEILNTVNKIIYQVDNEGNKIEKNIISYNDSKDSLIIDNVDNIRINTDALKNTIDEYADQHDINIDEIGNIIKDHTTISRAIDPDKARGATVSSNMPGVEHKAHFADWFGIRNMSWPRYNEEDLTETMNKLGEEKFLQQYGNIVEGIKDNQVVLKDNYKNKNIATNIHSNFVNNLLWDDAAKKNDRILAHNGKILLSDEELRNPLYRHIIPLVHEREKSNIHESKYKEFAYAGQANKAIGFNKHIIKNRGEDYSTEKEKLLQNGFKEIKSLDDLIISKGINEELVINESEKANINRENDLLIKLTGDHINKDDLNGVEYLALPAYTEKWLNDKEIPNKPQTQMYAILKNIQEYNKMVEDENYYFGEPTKGQTHDQLKHGVMEKTLNKTNQHIKEFTNQQIALYEGKHGQLAQFNRVNMRYGKTAKNIMFELYDESKNYLSDLDFEGDTLGDLYNKKNLPVSAVVLSSRFFDNEYYKSLEEFGVSSDILKEGLKSKGTLGYLKRDPEIYSKSFAPTAIYTSDNLQVDEMIASAPAMLAKKGDSDGDNITTLLQEVDTVINYADGTAQNVKLDYIRYNALQSARKNENLIKNNKKLAAITSIDLEGTAEDGSTVFDSMKHLMHEDSKLYRVFRDSNLAGGEVANQKSASVLDIAINARTLNSKNEIVPEFKLKDATTVRELGKMTRAHAGTINTLLTDFKDYVINDDVNNKESLAIYHTLEALEESYLTPKQSDKGILTNLTSLGQLSTSIGEMYRGNSSSFKQFLNQDQILERKEIKQLIKSGDNPDGFFDTAEDVINTAFEYFSRTPYARNEFKQANLIGKGEVRNLDYHGGTSAIDTKLASMAQHMTLLSKSLDDDVNIDVLKDVRNNAWESKKINSEKDRRRATEQIFDNKNSKDKREIFKRVVNDTKKSFKENATSGNISAIAIAGIAGAFMTAGYVGGNPSEPAQNHAQEQQQQEEEYYSSNSLQDANLMMQQNPQQGYVININASTKKNKKETQKIISQAFSASVPTDVDIQMNMRDQYGNINDRDIQKIIERSLF